MTDIRKMIAEQIGLLVIATVEQQATIAALEAELAQLRGHTPDASAAETQK